MAHDESKWQEGKPVPVKPSLSEIFLEATNQLKGTEMTPDDIRNYTLSRYNVDVIKCMKDINLLTRFSEIKLPNVAPRKYSRIYSKWKPVNPKSLRRVSAKRPRRTKLAERNTFEAKRKVFETKRLNRRTKAVGKAKKKKSSVRSNTSDDQMKSRISLIRLIRNRSPIRKEFGFKENSPSGDSNVLARLQAPHAKNGKAVGDISIQNISNAPTECEAMKTRTNGLGDSTELSRDASGTSQDDVKNGFRDCPKKQNGSKDMRDSLKSESKIVKAGYAVKNFIEDLGTKYASGLMFSNQRSSDKSIRSGEEKMEEGLMYDNLRTVKIDLVKDNMKISTDWAHVDKKPTTVLASNSAESSKVTQDFKCDRLQGNRERSVIGVNRDLQDVQIVELVGGDHEERCAETGSHDTKSLNEKSGHSVETSTDHMLAVRRWENSRQSLGHDDIIVGEKVQQNVLRPKSVTTQEEIRPIKVGKPTRFDPASKNRNKTANKSSTTRISRNRSRKEIKENLHSSKNGSKSIKMISKKKKKTIDVATTGFGNSAVTKKTNKRTKPRVTFADDCGENCSSGTSQAKIHIPRKVKNGKSNGMEKLEGLVGKRRLRKKVK